MQWHHREQCSDGHNRRPGRVVGLSADGNFKQDGRVGLTALTNDGMGRTSWTSTSPINTKPMQIAFFTADTNNLESCCSVWEPKFR